MEKKFYSKILKIISLKKIARQNKVMSIIRNISDNDSEISHNHFLSYFFVGVGKWGLGNYSKFEDFKVLFKTLCFIKIPA